MILKLHGMHVFHIPSAQSSADCAVISTEFLRTSGLLCCWSDDVELSTETIV